VPVVIPARLQNRLPEFRAHLANQVRDWIAHLNNRDAELRQKSIADCYGTAERLPATCASRLTHG